MALKQSNKNRKKAINDQITDGKCPLKCWWWFPRDAAFYALAVALVSLVVVFL
mgnify:FL=1